MPKIPSDLGWGGIGLQQLNELLRAVVDDLATLKAAVDELKSGYNEHVGPGEAAHLQTADAPQVDAPTNLTLTK